MPPRGLAVAALPLEQGPGFALASKGKRFRESADVPRFKLARTRLTRACVAFSRPLTTTGRCPRVPARCPLLPGVLPRVPPLLG